MTTKNILPDWAEVERASCLKELNPLENLIWANEPANARDACAFREQVVAALNAELERAAEVVLRQANFYRLHSRWKSEAVAADDAVKAIRALKYSGADA